MTDLISREAAIAACDALVHLKNQRHGYKTAWGAMDCREAIRALPAQAPAVKVKPLVWEVTDWSSGDGVKGENDCGWAAGTTLNSWGYSIDWLGGEFEVDLDGKAKSRHPTLEAAKAAAQADYEARILAAIEPAQGGE